MTAPATGISPKISAAIDFATESVLNETSYFVENGAKLAAQTTGISTPALDQKFDC